MGVYINMEMPKSCSECFVKSCNGRARNKRLMVQRGEDCPLVPVQPHGRLIDADALLERYGTMPFATVIVDAPTIIPAEPFNNLSKLCKDDVDFPICTKASPASLGIYKKAEEGE